MSKADDLRRIREANWHARQKTNQPQAKEVRQKAAADALVAALAPPKPVETVCGHRSVGGKTCIREKGHSEVQHRYAKAEKPKIDPDAEV